ncbi:MAG: hypothetical protein ABIQ38_03730 [Ilumatobacteraceae bacterium]
MIVCWSVKGGSGTTVVAATLALVLSARSPEGACVVDLAGDLPATLGMAEPVGLGVSDWLMSPDEVDSDSLDNLLIPASSTLTLLPRGNSPIGESVRFDLLAQTLSDMERPVVVDAGSGVARSSFIAHAQRSYLVIRPCYLALRNASSLEQKPTGIILITEDGRALGRRDVEAVIGAPVVAEIPYEASISRAVDAGLLSGRLPTLIGQRFAAVV